MSAEELLNEFNAAFSPNLRTAIVEALRKAYLKACEDHDEEEGSNPTTFGINVYHFSVKRLCDIAAEHGVEIKSRKPVFRLHAGGFDIGCHNVGHSERESIHNSFPDNQHAACTLVNSPQQLELGLAFSSPPDVQPAGRSGGVVIAHFGNPVDGLCAVYLALPDGIDEHKRIIHWGHTELLWKREDSKIERPPIQVILPPEETIQAPVVRRKPKTGDGV